MNKTSFTYIFNDEQQYALEKLLTSGNYQIVDVPYTTVAAEAQGCRICLYKTKKCVIQGKGAADWVQFVLEPLILQKAEYGYENILDPKRVSSHMGVDESGKGDFFGPLVIASVYIDPALGKIFDQIGVRDSKNISTDKRIRHIAKELRKALGKRFSLVTIGPRAYNRLYGSFKNVNRLLAWGHARAIENLINIVPDCPRAVADQFGPVHRIEQALMKKGKTIELIQKHKAESDPAVAGASILAREGFIQALDKLGKKYDMQIPRGASRNTMDIAKDLVRKEGPHILLETAKCHFKTTDQVLEECGYDRTSLENKKEE